MRAEQERWSGTTANREETERIGGMLAAYLGAGDVVAFRGGLGAGKTAMIRGILRALGADGAVPSPTFNIVNEYRLPGLLAAHFDLYRIGGAGELESVGFYDYLGRALLLIEWSERVPDVLDEGTVFVTIDGSGDEPRAVRVRTPGKILDGFGGEK